MIYGFLLSISAALWIIRGNLEGVLLTRCGQNKPWAELTRGASTCLKRNFCREVQAQLLGTLPHSGGLKKFKSVDVVFGDKGLVVNMAVLD